MTEKQMQAKQYLKQVYRCNELLKNGFNEIENLRAMSTSIASPDLTKEKVSATPSYEAPFANAINKLVDLEKQMDEEMVQYFNLKADIRDTIYRVEDVKRVLVLRYRYIEFMTWDSIAVRMDYSIKQLHRIHNAALTDVADVLAAKDNAA